MDTATVEDVTTVCVSSQTCYIFYVSGRVPVVSPKTMTSKETRLMLVADAVRVKRLQRHALPSVLTGAAC